MKRSVYLLVITFLLSLSGFALAEDVKIRAMKTEPPARATATATTTSPKDIAASPQVAASAACCLKQCGGGGNCGLNCTIVDSLSQCGQVNFKFECPGNQGMSCLGSNCSCQ